MNFPDGLSGLDRVEARHWQRRGEALAVPLEEEQEMAPGSRSMPRPPARQVIRSGYTAR
jgi:hypothetical protein